MKLTINILLLIGTMLFITGCSTTTINFDKKYIGYESNEYISNKITTKIVSIEKMNYSIGKRPNSLLMGKAITLEINSDYNEKVLKSVLNQYFSNVTIDNNKNVNIKIYSTIKDFDWQPIFGGQESSFIIDVKVLYQNKEILSKTYSKKYDDAMFVETINFGEVSNYTKNKHLFRLYEKEFIPDLTKALRKNM